MTGDPVTCIGGSKIQHGKLNDRVYLMKLADSDDAGEIIRDIDRLAAENGYSKAFAKVPEDAGYEFIENGYICEARIPGFFSGNSDGFFLSKYYTRERQKVINPDEIMRIIRETTRIRNRKESAGRSIPGGLTIRRAGKEDSGSLSELYGETFESYPFPIHESSYIEETMDDNIVYFGIWSNGNLLAASSCETDISSASVEMTDFAVSGDQRGKGYGSLLLEHMETEMKSTGFVTSFTIARAAFDPVNFMFARHGYEFGGTLKNNTCICGSFESMNVWYKKLN